MEIKLDIQEQEQANQFLRAFWAELRSCFTKQAWQFTPSKNGMFRRITFGQVDLGLADGPIMVGVSYKKRGSIKRLFFERPFGQAVESDSHLVGLLKETVNSALAKANHPSRMFMEAIVQPAYSQISEYASDWFVLKQLAEQKSVLMIPIWAYDLIDAQAGFRLKANYILDVLATETNIPFWQVNEANLSKDEKIDLQEIFEVFVDNPDWIDNVPIKNDRMILSKEGKKFLSLIVRGETDTNGQVTFLRACRHFHMALKLRAESYGVHNYNEWQENVMVLCVSALEVASTIDGPTPSSCSKCGQPVYKIRRRVSDFTSRYLPNHVVKFIKSYYDRRSKYLHAGMLLSNQDYVGITLPQLDADNPTGCKNSIASSSIMNLHEFVGYCLRQTLKSLVKGTI